MKRLNICWINLESAGRRDWRGSDEAMASKQMLVKYIITCDFLSIHWFPQFFCLLIFLLWQGWSQVEWKVSNCNSGFGTPVQPRNGGPVQERRRCAYVWFIRWSSRNKGAVHKVLQSIRDISDPACAYLPKIHTDKTRIWTDISCMYLKMIHTDMHSHMHTIQSSAYPI